MLAMGSVVPTRTQHNVLVALAYGSLITTGQPVPDRLIPSGMGKVANTIISQQQKEELE